MSRNLSNDTIAALFAEETDEVFVTLLTLGENQLEEPIRVCDAGADFVSNGETFSFYPFGLIKSDDTGDRPARARLKIENVSRFLVDEIRSLTDYLSLRYQLVRAAAPDVVEQEFTDFKLVNIKYDALQVEADLVMEEYTAARYPAETFSKAMFPGLF